MNNPYSLRKFNEDTVNEVLSTGGKIFVFKNKIDIVCSMMYIPVNAKAIENFELNHDFKDVGECGPIMVNCKYIGNNLQSQMIKYLENYIKQLN